MHWNRGFTTFCREGERSTRLVRGPAHRQHHEHRPGGAGRRPASWPLPATTLPEVAQHALERPPGICAATTAM